MNEIYKNLSLENLENEIWRDIVGYEYKYQVSSLGRVKSLANDKLRKEKILRQRKNNKTGYLCVNLYKEGKGKNFGVHRLVGNAFLENKNGYPCFNHKNEIKTDNRVENLEPCTHKYNLNYKNAQARRLASIDWKAVAEKLSRQVYQYNKQGTLVSIWQSVNKVGRNGFDNGAVCNCCNGKRKTHRGFIWSYTPIYSK